MLLKSVSWVVALTAALMADGSYSTTNTHLNRVSKDGLEYQEVTLSPGHTNLGKKARSLGIRLKNNLQAVVISDPDAVKSAAQLQVWVGSQSDPKYMPGLAHFYEHMLFMGSKKYPSTTEYLSYIANHAGDPNAFTRYEETGYKFEINHSGLEGALDRFSQFFIYPELDKNSLNDEVKKVHSEFVGGFTFPRTRLEVIQKHTGDPNHPYTTFNTGTHSSLIETPLSNNINPRDELIKFRDQYYSANIMRLVVIGNFTTGELVEMVVSKFSDIVDKGITVPNFQGSPFRAQDKGVIINAVTGTDDNYFDIQFDMPSQFKYQNELPIQYLKHLLLSQGPGTLYSKVLMNKWATEVYSRTDNYYREFSEFTLSFDLTQEGIDHREDILKLVFEMIRQIKLHGITEDRFNELKIMGEMRNRFKERDMERDTVEFIADSMLYVSNLASVLNRTGYPQVYNETLIREFVSYATPDNMRVSFMSRENNKLPNLVSEPWYMTKYCINPIDKDLMRKLNDIVAGYGIEAEATELTLPRLNRFIPTDFSLVHSSEKVGYPNLIYNLSSSTVWHTFESERTPKATINILFCSSINMEAPSNKKKVKSLKSLINSEIAELVGEFKQAGVYFYLFSDEKGISLNLRGFSQNLEDIAKLLVGKIRSIKFTPSQISESAANEVGANATEERPNHTNKPPATIIYNALVLSEVSKDISTTPLTIDVLFNSIFFESAITMFASGNILPETSISIMESIRSGSTSSIKTKPLFKRTIHIPDGGDYVLKRQSESPEELNSSVGLYIDLNEIDDYQEQAYTDYLSMSMFAPAFNQLRTIESLGYGVSTHASTHGDRCGFYIRVEGESEPNYVEHRIEEFLINYTDLVRSMTRDDFNYQVSAYVLKAQSHYRDIRGLNDYYWRTIKSEKFNFQKKDSVLESLRNIKQEKVVEILQTQFLKGSTKRRKISAHVIAEKSIESYSASIKDPKMNPGTFITDLDAWQADLLDQLSKK